VIPTFTLSTEGLMSVSKKKVPALPLEVVFSVADRDLRKVESSDDVKEFFDDMEEQVQDVESEDPLEILKTICPEKDVFKLCVEVCNL